jgi:hypothetical protein
MHTSKTIVVAAMVLMWMVQSLSAQGRQSMNFLPTLKLPTAQQDALTQSVAQQLAKTAVPTAKDAESIVLSFLINGGPGLDAREGLEVAGLYAIARDVPGFAKTGDLFWEVRLGHFGVRVSRVVWVSTSTKSVKTLFP